MILIFYRKPDDDHLVSVDTFWAVRSWHEGSFACPVRCQKDCSTKLNQSSGQPSSHSTPLNYGQNQIICNSNLTNTSDEQLNLKLIIQNFEDFSLAIKQSLESLVMKSTIVISSTYHLKMITKTLSHNAQSKETIWKRCLNITWPNLKVTKISKDYEGWRNSQIFCHLTGADRLNKKITNASLVTIYTTIES